MDVCDLSSCSSKRMQKQNNRNPTTVYCYSSFLDILLNLLIKKWFLHSGDFPGASASKESTCQWRRHRKHRFHPWVRNIPWRRKWQPAPVFLPGKSCGQRSLVGCSPWGCRVRHDLATEHVLFTQGAQSSTL